MNVKKLLLGIVIIVPIVAMAGFILWAYTPLGPMPEALDAMESNPRVNVEENSWIIFAPTKESNNTGLIFYPGGRVDPRSYAPAAMQFAERGYLTVIVPMPLNLAIFGSDRADEVIAHFPEIDNWVIAGHSLGGSMAARYAFRNLDDVDGLVLWAAYPAEGDDLSNSAISSASIFGTNDGLVSDQDILIAESNLPEDNLFQLINGGNHAQFGWYGEQAGDNAAEISREQQQMMIISTTNQILNQIKTGNN